MHDSPEQLRAELAQAQQTIARLAEANYRLALLLTEEQADAEPPDAPQYLNGRG